MSDTNRLTQAELRNTVRDLIDRWRSEARYQPRSDSWLRSLDVEFSKELASRGLIGMTWPRDYGGGEYTNTDRMAVTEELLRAGAPVAAHWIADRQIGPAILRYGTQELREEILPGIVSADYLFCLGMSEPEAGSDLAAVRTTATPVDGGWMLKGRKIWTTGAHRASHAYVLARTSSGERKHQGLSELIVDMDAEGVLVSPILDMAGEHHFNELVFEDVFVPRGRLLGEEGNGWRQVVEQLSFERGGPERVLSTYPLLVEILGNSDVIRHRRGEDELGEFVARLASLRSMAFDVAAQLDRGEAPVQEAATLKYLGNVFERDVVEYGRRILGPGGQGSAYGQALLASPGFSLRGGAADVLLSIIVRQEASKDARVASPMAADKELTDLAQSLSELNFDQRWQQIRELGLVGIGVDEQDGGSGGTVDDLASLVAEFGTRGVSSPLIEASVGYSVLAECGRLDLLPDESDYATVAFGSSDELTAPCAGSASLVLLVDDQGEVAVVGSGSGEAKIEHDTNVAGESYDRVTVTDRGDLVRLGRVDVADVRARQALLWSAALCGALDGTYDLTRGYVSTREQFGAPLLKIPAVAAHLATMKTQALLARTAFDRAAAAYRRAGASPAERLGAAAVARITASAAADETTRIAHQLHGAIGTTAEYDLHRFTLRLWAWRDTDLPAREWAALLGDRALTGGEQSVWASLTAGETQAADVDVV
ncbi:acyl-CoA dehydrogenase family protein [Mycolicibacterium hodleri]|uniref:Acyl-CoA dehydrogenase n=1 Tax=Mycolicibacterium hodleri TaxID=49897 RepID=A0A502E615_9MYCO|nr:acyl-CoA dehydrogenase family protein [Mycolicibacterium hodleri]TPG32399.1 acyl-CoA dehydrogenase [Mycolicibacterium hodleri]